MQILREVNGKFYGIKRTLYTVIFSRKRKKYCYYLNAYNTKNLGDTMISKSANKSMYLNKYTLPILGLLYTIYQYTLKVSLVILYVPLFMYFDGCRNFMRDKSWYQNVRYFNWINILIIIFLTTYIIIKK